MQKITTCLAFNDRAEEAVNFYTSIFSNSKITRVTHYGAGAPMPQGSVMAITFQLEGQEIMAMNGGSYFTFSEGISLFVDCKSQQEIDTYWERLSEGGQKGPCGWLKDKFGVSWQVAPSAMDNMLQDEDPEKAQRVMAAMLKMTKIDIKQLEEAYAA